MVQKLCFYEISIHHIVIDISLQGKESDYMCISDLFNKRTGEHSYQEITSNAQYNNKQERKAIR